MTEKDHISNERIDTIKFFLKSKRKLEKRIMEVETYEPSRVSFFKYQMKTYDRILNEYSDVYPSEYMIAKLSYHE